MRNCLLVVAALSFAACSGSNASGSSGKSSAGGSSSSGSGGSSPGAGGGSTGTSGGVPPGGKRIFVTSTIYVGSSFGGVDGADQQCNLSAQSQNLDGTWKAILSNSNTAAFDRLADVGPWYLLDGTKVFNNKAGLATTPLAPIDITEQGQQVKGDATVWTGTQSGGTAGSDCNGWTDPTARGTIGLVFSTTSWIQHDSDFCSNAHSLYCIEQ